MHVPSPLHGTETYGVRVAAASGGTLVLELSRPFDGRHPLAEEETGRLQENASLRGLARQMAEVSDSRQLLQLLCAAASAQCHGSGAAVIKTSDDEGVVVAAVGEMAAAAERRFPLAGSLVAEALQNRGAVSIEHFSGSTRPLARLAPELRIGPMLSAPLVAHDKVLGVLTVVRSERAVSFSTFESQRLSVIADHAALALWKAELLEQARAADRAKGRFLATVSHELRTPLTALTGYEELLADEVLGPLSEPQSDVLERMRSVTHHLTVMIEEVLTFSSIEAGRVSVRPTDFLADDLLRAATAIVEPLARQKKLRVVCDLPAEPIRMSSDIDKIRQVIVNLAGNAVKFTDCGEVRLSLERVCSPEGVNEVHFSVHDTGAGIAQDDLDLLFRPFSQLDTGLTRRHGGTGLGLYISQRLAMLLGGRVEVESTPGSGSTFTLALPLDDHSPAT
jgi:signal transduction histidine kinase